MTKPDRKRKQRPDEWITSNPPQLRPISQLQLSTHPGREILRLSGPRKVWSEIEGSHFGRGYNVAGRSRLSDLERTADFAALALV